MASAQPKIGILAGAGLLPQIIVEACQKEDRPYHIIGFEDFTEKAWLEPHPHSMSRLAAVGKTIKILKKNDVEEVVLAGTIKRPNLSQLVPDIKGAKVLMHLLSLGRLGDDGLLKELSSVLEKEGFTIRGAHEIQPDLLTPQGVLTKNSPSKQQQHDIDEAMRILAGMSQYDIGQGLVMQDGMVLGIEAVEGTTKLIERCGDYKRKGGKPVLIKRKKLDQDSRFDLPAIGPHTIDTLAKSGYGGVAVECGATIILDRETVIAKAEREGLFVIGIKSNG